MSAAAVAATPGLGATIGAGLGTLGTAIAGMSNPLGWATLGVGALTSIAGTGEERKAGERKMGFIAEQQQGLESALGQLGEITSMKTEMAGDTYGMNLNQAMFQGNQSLYGLTRQGQSAAARTGFASSGQVQSQTQRATDAGVASFGFQRQGLQDVLGQKLMDIAEFKGAEEGRISSEQSRLRYEMKEAKAQKNKKFLGVFG